ncbi:hypothetical protein GE061_013686 [Apolygus lucorum]|uniref:Zinc finger DNA binding protein n=1 Tax=Apolygus lucorum TaxID=248454 RepID=A0A8S9XNH5_APOLU|nr:hypothetical protein GE061_013686 [Apolygus lucorum]
MESVAKLNRNMTILLTKIEAFGDRMKSMEEAMNFFGEQYEDMKERMTQVENVTSEVKKVNEDLMKGNSELRKEVCEMKKKIDDLEQVNLTSIIEIKGIPYTQNEELAEVITKLADKLNVPETDRQYESVYRVRPKRTDGNAEDKGLLIMKLPSYKQKKSWIGQIKVYKDLTAKDLHSSMKDSKIFINDRLTAKNSALYWLARKFGKHYGYRFVWTNDGRIFMKKDELSSTRVIRVLDADQLRKMDQQKAIQELYSL